MDVGGLSKARFILKVGGSLGDLYSQSSLGWVRIKEKGYIPTTKDGYVIKSGSVSMKADRFYASVLIEIPDNKTTDIYSEGIGIDLGLKDFAILSNGKKWWNNPSGGCLHLRQRIAEPCNQSTDRLCVD